MNDVENKERLKGIVKPLLKWYEQNKRMLPWREHKDPYFVWISEIMLQQTKIEAVKGYYDRFIKKVPTIHDLATIPEQELLKLWEGLGYYNRAKNLKKAAEIMVQKYNGNMPQTYDELKCLPGIGEYTAGAIASIAFCEKVPAVDGNVLRVISRIIASDKDILLLSIKKEITELLVCSMPEKAGDFNESLMELGEVICIPNGKPLCQNCPLNKMCLAKERNLTSEIPRRVKKKVRRKEQKTVFLFQCKDKIAISKREKSGLLSGLYEFPNVQGFQSEEDINLLFSNWNLEKATVQKLGVFKHIFSHVEWEMMGYCIQVENINTLFLWKTKEEIQQIYAIPTAFEWVKQYWN